MTGKQAHTSTKVSTGVDAIRKNIRKMSGYTPGEQRNDAIKLNTNECPWPASPQVFTALQNIDDKMLRQYPSPNAQIVREAAAEVYNCSPNEVLVGNGSDDCLTIIYRSFLNAGDQVVSPWPSYGLYDTLADIQDVSIQHYDFQISDRAADTYTWTLPTAMAEAAGKICLLANPNNPSGTMVPVEDIVAFCKRWSGIVVVDEAYVDFASDAKQRAGLIPYIRQLDNLIVLRTFSKSYSLAGARVGLLFAHSALVAQLNKVKDSYNVNAMSQIIAGAALRDQEYHLQLVSKSLRSRQRIENECARYGWTWPKSDANFILCDVSNGNKSAEEIYTKLKNIGVLIRWWNSDQLRHSLRISTGTDQDLDRLFSELARILGPTA